MPEALVQAIDLTRSYGYGPASVRALSHATCTIFPGDRIALTGPSGSGKSTLLHLLGGLDNPTSGHIAWPALGTISQLRPRNVVDIFQGPSLLESLTVFENISLPLLMSGIDPDEATDDTMTALRAFAIAPLRDTLPSELSGGQAQRVAIARALAGHPALVLADEPTGQLDSKTAIHVLNTLVRLTKASGTSLLISTHDPNVARVLDRQWEMKDGHLHTDESGSEFGEERAIRRLPCYVPV